MHLRPENRGALIQVASQFNMLEMAAPDVTPERGVTRYQHDRTQGPACAMAAGAALIWRNYLVPVGGDIGQTAERQLDGLADLGTAFSAWLETRVEALWTMRNGYALATAEGLCAISGLLEGATPDALDDLRGLLRVGLHADVEVTDGLAPGPVVSQVFCSALPVVYSGLSSPSWAPFARLCWRPPTRRRCSAACGTPRGAPPTACSSPALAEARSATTTPGSTGPCCGRCGWRATGTSTWRSSPSVRRRRA